MDKGYLASVMKRFEDDINLNQDGLHIDGAVVTRYNANGKPVKYIPYRGYKYTQARRKQRRNIIAELYAQKENQSS